MPSTMVSARVKAGVLRGALVSQPYDESGKEEDAGTVGKLDSNCRLRNFV